VRKAQRNVAGASAQIRGAERNSGNPNAPVPHFNPNRPFQQLSGSANAIKNTARGLNKFRGRGDDLVDKVGEGATAF